MGMKIKQWKCTYKEVSLDIFLYTVNMVLLTLGYRVIAYAWGLRGSEWTGEVTGNIHGDMGVFEWDKMKNIVVLLTAIGALITVGVLVLLYLFTLNQQYKRNRQNALESAMGYKQGRICRGNILEEEIKAVIAFIISIGISMYVWSWFDKIEYVSMIGRYWKTDNDNVIIVYGIVGAIFFVMIAVFTKIITEFALIDDEANLLREE